MGEAYPNPKLSCERPHKSSEPGDILLSVRAPVGAMNMADQAYGIGRGLCAIRVKDPVQREFLYYTLVTTKEVLKRASTGSTYDAVSIGDVGNIATPLPPIDEQAAIVRYLDAADEKIQAYISAKQRLIALLEELRQAIIHQAVTKGLDPNVTLKPSGVEWLGDVPEHWEIQRSKQIFRPRGELAKPDDIQLSATQAYGVIPQDEFEENIGRRVVKISLNLEKHQHVEVDDFVISMRSFQGGLERAWATGCIRSSYVVLSLVREVDTQFFSFLFKSQAYIRALQLTANFIRDGQDLNFNNFSAVDLPVPPIEEQKETGKYLGESTTRIETTISRTRRQIELMEEYRTRLIADVVTGKVDVQNAKVQTPK